MLCRKAVVHPVGQTNTCTGLAARPQFCGRDRMCAPRRRTSHASRRRLAAPIRSRRRPPTDASSGRFNPWHELAEPSRWRYLLLDVNVGNDAPPGRPGTPQTQPSQPLRMQTQMTTCPSRRSAWIRLTGAITLLWLGVIATAPALAASHGSISPLGGEHIYQQCQVDTSPCDLDGLESSGPPVAGKWWWAIAISVVGAAIWDGIKWFINNLDEFWQWLRNRDVGPPSCSTDFLNDMSHDPC